jgi:hypothetical protein
MGIRYDAIAKNGTYTKDGVEKNKWVKVGVVVDTKNGGLALKIEQLPVPFDGWLQLAEPKAKEQAPSQEYAQAPSQQTISDDIPF